MNRKERRKELVKVCFEALALAHAAGDQFFPVPQREKFAKEAMTELARSGLAYNLGFMDGKVRLIYGCLFEAAMSFSAPTKVKFLALGEAAERYNLAFIEREKFESYIRAAAFDWSQKT